MSRVELLAHCDQLTEYLVAGDLGRLLLGLLGSRLCEQADGRLRLRLGTGTKQAARCGGRCRLCRAKEAAAASRRLCRAKEAAAASRRLR